MKILVCISNVPDTTSKINFIEDHTVFDTSGIQFVLNPYDEIALAKAITLVEAHTGSVTVINVGESLTEATIRKALATGADNGVRINGHPKNAWYVAKQIANYAAGNNFDLILTGRESIDYNGTQVAGYLGELLHIPSVSIAKSLDLAIEENKIRVTREIEGGKEILEINLPAVIGTAEGVAEPRIPTMRGIMSARTKPLEVIEPIAVEERSRLIQFEKPAPRGTVTWIDAAEPEKLVTFLHNEAKVI